MKRLASQEQWEVAVNPSEDHVKELRRNLRLDNLDKVGPDEEEFVLAIFLREENENLMSGISGMLLGATIEIDYLWVDESFRGKGTGARLVSELEKSAADRGCTTSITNTLSFQAPEFYQKLGYEVFGEIPGFGGKYIKYFLRKDLKHASALALA